VKLTSLAEPDLEFHGSTRHVDPRRGISDYGPADATDESNRTIRVGVVGSNHNIDGVRRWLDKCRQPISAKDSRLSRFYIPFPGFTSSTGFYSSLVFDSRLERPLTEKDLRRIASLPALQATREAVRLYVNELERLNEQPGCDVVLIARPDDLPERAAAKSPLRPWDKPTDGNSENFRALLKAEGMRFSRPMQILRRSTWDPTFKDTRAADPDQSQQDEATRAWNLHTALYYKAGGVPWRLPRNPTELDSCYVGVTFYKPLDSPSTLRTSVAQVFNQRGDGVIVRGGPVNLSEDKQAHLTGEDADALLSDALAQYKSEHFHLPARVVLHKTSSFTTEETTGFQAAADRAQLAILELLWLPSRDPTRLFRTTYHPPLRGTMITLSREHHLLYTRGSVPTYGTYPGMYIPSPLPFRPASVESSPEALAQEILGLTKMNWNQTQLDGKHPITIRTADKVGEILRHLPEDIRPQSRYAFYM
jgi:hypothetical protein